MSPELQELHQLCEGTLPQIWLDLLADYPAELTTAVRCDSTEDLPGTVAEVELLKSPQSLLEINLEARSGLLFTPENQAFHWPAALLVIGESGDGDYFCIDLRDEVPGVVQFVSQTASFEQLTDTFEEYVEMLRLAFCDNEQLEDDELEDDEFEDDEPEDDELEDDEPESDEYPL